jgi:hypothetical protein
LANGTIGNKHGGHGVAQPLAGVSAELLDERIFKSESEHGPPWKGFGLLPDEGSVAPDQGLQEHQQQDEDCAGDKKEVKVIIRRLRRLQVLEHFQVMR